MLSMPGVEESRTKARTNRPDYAQTAIDKTGELIREASGSGDLVVKIDLKTILPDLDQDKFSLALAHLRLELNTRGYYIKDYEHHVLPEDGASPYETKRGFYVYWGWGAENDD